MTQLTLAASNPALASMPPHQWAHDIRNILGTIGLHLETLEKLSGPAGGKAASAALALINRGGGMCAGVLAEASGPRPSSRPRGFDLAKTIKEVVALLEPTAPAGFKFRVDSNGSHIALGDQTEVFRISVQPRPECRRRRPAPYGFEPALDRGRPQGYRDRGPHFR